MSTLQKFVPYFLSYGLVPHWHTLCAEHLGIEAIELLDLAGELNSLEEDVKGIYEDYLPVKLKQILGR